MDDGRLVAGVAREGGGGDAGVGVSLGVDRLDGGDILRLHLHGLVGLGGAGVEEPAGKLRLVERGPRPIGGEEEGDRPFEVGGVDKQCPRLVAGRNRLSGGGGLWVGEGEREIAVAKQFAAGPLGEVEAVGGPDDSRAQLRHTIHPQGGVPVAALAGARAVGPLVKLERHPPHDELRRLGGEARIAPPSQPPFDVGVDVFWLRFLLPGKHPGAKQPGLEAVARILPHQRPGGDIHREAGVVTFVDFFMGDEQIARHLYLLDPLGGPGRGPVAEARWDEEGGEQRRDVDRTGRACHRNHSWVLSATGS